MTPTGWIVAAAAFAAAAVLFFGSEEAAYTTGQVIAVSGGFGLGTPVYAELSQLSAEDRH